MCARAPLPGTHFWAILGVDLCGHPQEGPLGLTGHAQRITRFTQRVVQGAAGLRVLSLPRLVSDAIIASAGMNSGMLELKSMCTCGVIVCVLGYVMGEPRGKGEIRFMGGVCLLVSTVIRACCALLAPPASAASQPSTPPACAESAADRDMFWMSVERTTVRSGVVGITRQDCCRQHPVSSDSLIGVRSRLSLSHLSCSV